MPLPNMNQTISEALRIMTDGQHHAKSEILLGIHEKFRMTDEERARKTAGGTAVAMARLGWAIFHLKKAGLAESVRGKGVVITKKGGEWAMARNEFTLGDLKQIKEYVEGITKDSDPKPEEPQSLNEELERVLKEFKAGQVADVRDKLAGVGAYRFEEIVMDLLEKMGYGRGTTTQRSRDGGIDGVVDMDRLGIGKVYMQAKRWTSNVGIKDIQAFTGSLMARKSQQGVFITTSDFTPDAREYSKNAGVNVVLVDGGKLLELMYEHDVGFAHEERMEIKSVDEGYFSE